LFIVGLNSIETATSGNSPLPSNLRIPGEISRQVRAGKEWLVAKGLASASSATTLGPVLDPPRRRLTGTADRRSSEHRISISALRANYSFSSRDLPIPILQASFCGIFPRIGIPTFFRRIVDIRGSGWTR
jgi:hypothetical protein